MAEALERLATAATQDGDLGTTAVALEEAAGVWDRLAEPAREGFCLLLAATTQRLRGDLGAARHNLERAAAAEGLPDGVRRALEVERAEQALALGDAKTAYAGFGEVLELLDAGQDGLVRARVLGRRAAAGIAAQRWHDAAGDLMDAEELFTAHGEPDEAEAAALGAALAVAHAEPETAERVWAAVSATAPRDGTSAARRGITGGRIALLAGDAALALGRFDAARQGALDAADPIAYLAAVSETVGAAEALGDDATAYARLATAWVTVGDLLGAEAGRALVRPLLEQLRERLGPTRFAAARTAYEKRPRAH
ncbi:hypothetical protein GPJ59_20380 [Streptomyces bambusae]|uniref:Tetratricopeptide repeat protein n=1 Tax=Streptomyces bambusae TaxID=1550616 RepID=A0ABS6Z8U3_9ACTN|nr:hypothetical protein [Streptomyces bambusae]